jgi:hypothetical protein
MKSNTRMPPATPGSLSSRTRRSPTHAPNAVHCAATNGRLDLRCRPLRGFRGRAAMGTRSRPTGSNQDADCEASRFLAVEQRGHAGRGRQSITYKREAMIRRYRLRQAITMRIPRVRFTVRRMMIASALTALVLWGGRTLLERRGRFEKRAQGEAMAALREIMGHVYRTSPGTTSPQPLFTDFPKVRYHNSLSEKYHFAARHPWLPVEPDPPAPE